MKDSAFFISLFKKASGEKVNWNDLTTDGHLVHTWGKTTGLFHRLTKEYVTPTHLRPRHDLVEEFQIQYAPFLPNDSLVKEATDAVLKAIRALPKESHLYGLIHSDLHMGNFLYNGTSIEVFDFDDCAFQHFTHDIAIPLYYSLWQLPLEDQEQILSFSKTFLTHFLNGYEEEYPVYSLSHLPLFLKLRDCELYAVLHKKLDLHSLTKKQQDLLERIRKRIVSKTAIIQIDTQDMML